MKPLKLLPGLVWLLAMPAAFADGPFDGKSNLLCTVQQLHECDSFSGCRPIDASVATPVRHLDVDISKKVVRLEGVKADLTSRISDVETVEGKLILQGTDSGLTTETDGGAWAMSINQTYGSMILTVAGHDVAFVGMGACVARR
jgi:hypothetical protein